MRPTHTPAQAATASLQALTSKLVKARHCLHATNLQCEATRAQCDKSRQQVEKNDAEIAALEEELKILGNSIGMGAMGFVGSSMVVDCHIEVGYTHTGGMPMSVHCFCLALSTSSSISASSSAVRSSCSWLRT